MAFPQTPLPIKVELKTGATWTDVTSDVRGESQIRITRGRSNEGQQVDTSLLRAHPEEPGGQVLAAPADESPVRADRPQHPAARQRDDGHPVPRPARHVLRLRRDAGHGGPRHHGRPRRPRGCHPVQLAAGHVERCHPHRADHRQARGGTSASVVPRHADRAPVPGVVAGRDDDSVRVVDDPARHPRLGPPHDPGDPRRQQWLRRLDCEVLHGGLPRLTVHAARRPCDRDRCHQHLELVGPAAGRPRDQLQPDVAARPVPCRRGA